MQLLLIPTLLIFLLYRHRVCSSKSLLFQNQTFIIDNVLEDFFNDFKDDFLDVYHPRSVTVVGGSSDDLRQTRPLLDRFPFIICEVTSKCSYLEELSRGNFVVVFLEDLSDARMESVLEILSNCKLCTVFFMFNGIVSLDLDDVWFVFKTAIEHNVAQFEFALLGNDSVELYTNFIDTNCSTEVRLVTVWRPGTSLDEIRTWAFQPRGLNGCPVSVSSLTFTPKMKIVEDEDGSLRVVDGREGKLMLMLAEKLNFSISLRYPSVADQLKFSRKLSILNDVASGISEIGIGRLRPNNHMNDTVLVSVPYDRECITWGVPRIINSSNNIVWVEFSWEVWLSIGLVYVVSYIIGYAHRINGERRNPGFMTIFLDAVAVHLGNPVIHVPSSPGARFMLTAMLFYSTVITTAYKSSLASLLATDRGSPMIVDAEGIIDADIAVGGSLDDYNILQDQVNESRTSSVLLERFQIMNNDSGSWDRLLSGNNFAFMGRRSVLDYERQSIIKAYKPVKFDVLSDCVLAYHTVIAFKKRSFLRKPADDMIQRLTESGILKHWDIDDIDTDKILQRRALQMYYDERGAYKFWNIFWLYFYCLTVSLLCFLVELLAPRLDPRNHGRA